MMKEANEIRDQERERHKRNLKNMKSFRKEMPRPSVMRPKKGGGYKRDKSWKKEI